MAIMGRKGMKAAPWDVCPVLARKRLYDGCDFNAAFLCSRPEASVQGTHFLLKANVNPCSANLVAA